MTDPFVLIEGLIERAQARIDLHNSQPHNASKQITLADTIEARAAEWISDHCRNFLMGDGKVYRHPLAPDMPPYGWRDIIAGYASPTRLDDKPDLPEDDITTERQKWWNLAAKAIGEDLEILEKRGRIQNLIARIPIKENETK